MSSKQKGKSISVIFPLLTKSEMNQREHWAARHSRMSKQKIKTKAMLWNMIVGVDFGKGKIKVTLTRISTRLLDDDNLVGAFKAVRDAIAAMIGIDDGSSRYAWIYKQMVEKKVKPSIAITIEY